MSLLHWVSGSCYPTVVSIESLTNLLMVARAVLLCLFLVVVGLTVSHFAEGRRAVKFILSFEVSSRSYELYSTGSPVLSRCIRAASRIYETSGTGFNFSGEDFQNRGTFIVVRSSVFAVSSAHKTHLARDAYSAC